MRIALLHFFTLPIDSTYKNVIMHRDDTATTQRALNVSYRNMLMEKYESIVITTPNSHGINRMQNKIEFSLKYDYNAIRNCNYVAITQSVTNQVYFYFIDSVDENNSDGSIHIVASWDVWANNLFHLNKQDYDVLTERRTTKDFELDPRDETNETIQVYSKKMCTNDGEVASKRKNFALQSEGYEILWLRLTLDPELENGEYVFIHSNLDSTIVPRTNPVVQGSFPYVYHPIMRFHKGLLYGQDLANEKFILDTGDYTTEIAQPGELKDAFIAFANMNPTWILKADLTFNAPFDCEFNDRETVIFCSGAGVLKWREDLTENESFIAMEKYCIPRDKYEQIDTIMGCDLVEYDSTVNRDILTEYLGTFSSYIKGNEISDLRVMPNVNEQLSDLDVFKYWVNRYMYPYLKVKVNTKEGATEIKPNHADFNCEIYSKMGGEGIILSHQTLDYNKSIIEVNGDTMRAMQSNTSLPLTKSAYEAYTQYNANSIAVKQGLAALGAIVGVASTFAGIPAYAGVIGKLGVGGLGIGLAGAAYATKGVGSSISAASGYFETNAQINDSKNQASILSNSNFSASLDVFKSDRVLISVEIPNEADDETLAIAKSVKKFGNCINCYHPLLARVKEKFEYIKTVDCNVSWVPNAEDRAVLNQIFDAGVHMWYSDNLQPNEAMNFYYYINLDSDIERI